MSESLLTRRGFVGAMSVAGCLRAAAPDHRNFEMEVEARAMPGVVAGVRFHKRFDVRVGNGSRQKTGSLLGFRNVYKRYVPDGQWFKLAVAVRGNNIQVHVDGVPVVDYTSPAPLDRGRLALHGPSENFRNLNVRMLPDGLATPGPAAVDDALSRKIVEAARCNIPMADFHVHLKAGLTLAQAVAKSLRDGIQYGIAVNCGRGFPTETDAGARDFFESMKGQPIFIAMQAEGREWTQMFSRAVVEQFDYVFTDSMTWTDNHGRRMRTWIPEEVGAISDPQEFMDTLVSRAVGILETERVNIYANPTFLPDVIAKDYETLWTDARRKKVIAAAVKNHVAIEINNRYKLPSASFIQMAKASGAKFTFGTNNTGPQDLGRCEYGLQMIDDCKLQDSDFWTPA